MMGIDSNIELNSGTVIKLNQVIVDSFEKYMKREIPRMEEKKRELVELIGEENKNIQDAIDDTISLKEAKCVQLLCKIQV